jgi:hypothetical protein
VQVVAAKPPYTFKNRTFLTFEKVSLVPIQTKMLVPEMLTEKEVSGAVNGVKLAQISERSVPQCKCNWSGNVGQFKLWLLSRKQSDTMIGTLRIHV